MSRVLLVVDMQKGVFSTPRMDRIGRVERINQLSRAAERVIFIKRPVMHFIAPRSPMN